MRTRLAILLAGVAGPLVLGQVNSKADVVFSAGLEIHSRADFYQPLTACGSWIDVAPYGRCWHPRGIAADWRPYCDGHWEWTDCGWYWASDEPWAWACYHYGSWTDDPNYGWVWISGTEWAPAWVTWREGPDYIGWAPCGPGGVVLGPSFFVFVDAHRFHQRIHRRDLVVNDRAIITRTSVINGFRREGRTIEGVNQRVVINQGPRLETVQLATGTRLTPRPIHEVVTQTPVPEAVRHNGHRDLGVERERRLQDLPPTGPAPSERVVPPGSPVPLTPVRPAPPPAQGHGRGHGRDRD